MEDDKMPKPKKMSKKDIEIFNLKQEIKDIKLVVKEYEKNLVKSFEVLENDKKSKDNNITYGFIDLKYENYEKQLKAKAYFDKKQLEKPENERKEFRFKEFKNKPYVWNLLVFERGKGRKVMVEVVDKKTGEKKDVLNKSYIYLLKIYTESNDAITKGSVIQVFNPTLKRQNYKIRKEINVINTQTNKKYFAYFDNNEAFYRCYDNEIINIRKK